MSAQGKSPGRNKLGRRIAPGMWEDADGNPHFSLPELLVFFELEDTPENRSIATKNIIEALRRDKPDLTIVERQTPAD